MNGYLDDFTYYPDIGMPDAGSKVYYPGNRINSIPGASAAANPQGAIGSQDATNATTVGNVASGLLNLADLHTTLLQQQGLIATGTGSDPNRQQVVATIGRPWVEQPDNSDPFDYESGVALPGVGATSTVVSFPVPIGSDGVINAFSWNFTGGGFTQNSGTIIVQLLRNGVPIKNYDNITVEKGSIQQPRQISALRIYSGQVISMVVTHVADVTLNGNVVGSFVGYTYPNLS